MEIKKELNKDELVLKVIGEVNSTNYQELEDEVNKSASGVKSLVFDFSELEYLSSAGLRVLLISKKLMDKKGKMVIRGANKTVMDIFEITGFSNVLDFE